MVFFVLSVGIYALLQSTNFQPPVRPRPEIKYFLFKSLRGGKVKAAEVRSLVPFMLDILREYQHKLPPNKAALLLLSGESIQGFMNLLYEHGRFVPPRVLQQAFDFV